MVNILHARCVLITGATSGIGRALALAIHELQTKPTVIVVGRRQERLDELAQLSDRIKSVQFDVSTGREALKQFAADMVSKFPELDAVVFSAGVQHVMHFKEPEKIDVDLFETELNTNYTSIATLIAYLLPHFLQLSARGLPSFIIPISSNLGIVPFTFVPGYSATKAALHSLCLSLTVQLRDTNVHVQEIMPPLVESELHDHQGTAERLSKFWMPLDAFTKECVEKLLAGDVQIPVGAEAVKKWERFEKGKIETMSTRPH